MVLRAWSWQQAQTSTDETLHVAYGNELDYTGASDR